MKDEKKNKHLKESSAMRKKRIAKNLFLAVCSVFLAGSVTGLAVACDEGTPPPVIITEGQETGVYYFADGEQEYLLTLNSGNRFTLIGGADNRSGSYTIADGALTFSFVKIGEEEAIAMSGTLDGDVLTVNYGETATRFLKKVNYTVLFETNGAENAIDAVTVMNGKSIAQPAAPTKANKTFAGWYLDEDCTQPFFFGTTPVTGNTKLYALWVDDVKGQKEYTVDFNVGEGVAAIEAKTTVEGKLYGVVAPERAGYEFAGWWIGVDNSADKLSYQWTKDTVFDANTTLHALWTVKPEGGKLAAPVVNVSGTNISWNGVENAQTYELVITNASGAEVLNTTIGTTSKNFNFADEAAGEYQITVKALASDETKNSDATVRYYANKMLTRVSQFSIIDPSVLVFNPVENAEEYLITVVCGTDGHVHKEFSNGTSTSYNFANCDAKDGVLTFTVTAVAEGYASSVSETYTYVRNALNEVTGMHVDEATETLVWDAVDGATNYVVKVVCGNEEHAHVVNNGTKTSYNLKECEAVLTETGVGAIKITVRAEAKGYASAAATEFEYTKTKLATPSGMLVKDTVLSWNAVTGATEYVVKIGTNTYTTTTNSIDLSLTGVNWVGGNVYDVSVYAKSEDNESLYSDVITVSYYAMNSTVTYKNGMVSWKPVMGAKNYEVKVNNGKVLRINDGSYQANVTLTKAGVNTISVRYYDGEAYSDWAKIEVFAHEIIFDSRAGANVDTVYKANGDTITLPETNRHGYEFDGWYNAPGGAAGNAAKFEDGIVNVTGSIALYASWTPAQVEVTFNTNIEDYVMDPVKVTYTKDFTLAVPENNKGEQFFLGWFTSINCTENTRLTDQFGVGVGAFNFPDGVTVYAGWANALKFKQLQNGTYSVSKGSDLYKMTEIRIPAYYNGALVSEMDTYSFQYSSKLEKVYIPDTISLIERNVFYACPNLQTVEMYTPEVEAGYQYEVYYETVDGVIIRRDNLTGERQIYFVPAGKTGRVAIPEGVTEVPARVFTGVAVSEVVIPTTVETIRQNAFQNCTSLKKITFAPSGDEEAKTLVIEKNAFRNCSALTSVSLPKRLSNISIDKEAGIPDVFTGCNALAYVHIEEGSANYSSLDGMLTNVARTKILYCPVARAGVVSIPNVVDIAPNAFKNCDRITEISIPGCVDLIGENAFEGCDRLTKVVFEETDGVGLTRIGKNAFKDCGKLQYLVFDKNSEVGVIGETAFSGCVTLTDISFPKSLTSIEKQAFAGCKAITKLKFAEDGDELALGDYAFANCLSLTEVTLPACVNSLSLGAFNGCASLEKIFVDENNQTYCDDDGIVFTKDMSEILYYSVARKATTYALPDKTTRIAGAVFKGNKYITSFVIPARVTYVGESAFEGCTKLASLTIEQGEGEVVDLEIAKNAFKGCTASGLTTLVIPERTKTIGTGVLQGCSKLTTVTVPSTLTAIPDNMFNGCSKLNNFVIPAGVTVIGNNAFYGCSGWKNTADTPLVLPTGLQTIGNSAFQGCSYLVAIQIPETVTSIGTSVFKSCTRLAKVNIPANITAIPTSMFESCGAITSFVIPAHVTSIGNNAFKSTKLTQIVIPATVTTIGEAAFYGISTLVDVVANGAVTQEAVTFATGSAITEIGKNVFYSAGSTSSSASVSITIPKSVAKIATGAFQSSKFRKVTFEDGGTADLVIDASAFQSATYLVSISLPDRLTSIGNNAFNGNSKLTTVTINPTSKLTTIGSKAFYQCTLLSSIYIPKTVHDTTDAAGKAVPGIGTDAFARTKSLATITFGMDEYADGAERTELTISSYAFGSDSTSSSYVNKLLTTVKFPSRVANINVNAFKNCSAFTAYDMEAGGVAYSAQDGILYSGDKTILYTCPAGKEGDIVIPNTVTLVKANAFYGCEKITKVTFTDAEENAEVLQAGKGLVIGDGGTTSAASASVFGLCKTLTEIILPNYLEYIGPYAFSGDYSSSTSTSSSSMKHPPITSITIPANVRTIDKAAFYSVIQLETVIFEDNSKLETIGMMAFYSAKALHTIQIPKSVVSIGDSSFSSCTALKSIAFEDYTATGSKLESIGNSAFSSSGLTGDLKLPDSVVSIGSSAFSYCNFNTVYISKNVTSLTNVFNYVKLSAFSVDENNPNYVSKDGVLYGKSNIGANGVSSLEVYPVNRVVLDEDDEPITTYEILEGTTSIASQAFMNNNTLQEVIIPNTVTNIGNSAFSGASKLNKITFTEGGTELTLGWYAFASTKIKSLHIPAHMKEIGDYAFRQCYSLEGITFADNCSLEKIAQQAFAGCYNLYAGKITVTTDEDDEPVTVAEPIVLPGQLTTIGSKAFAGCQRLENIVFPNSLVEIGSEAFGATYSPNQSTTYYQPQLTEVILPDSVTTIGEKAFYNCGYWDEYYDEENDEWVDVWVNSIQTIKISAGLTEIPAYAFYGANITELVLPDTITSVGDYAFSGCADLETVTFSATIENIGNYSFYGCGFTEIIVPNTVKTIGNSAFEECSNVEKIELRDGVISIGDSAFAGCVLVKVMQLPASLETLGSDPFRGIAFDEFAVAPDNTNILIENGFMYDSTKETILKYFGSDESVTIPFRVTRIGGGAFANNPGLREIIMHEDITYIGDYAFQNTLFESFTIGKKVTYLGQYAFADCANLKTVVFEDGCPSIARINDGTFKNCTALSSINLPTNIYTSWDTDENWMYPAAIGSEAFYGCTSLTSIDLSVLTREYSIGYRAFAYSGLTEILITANCTSHDQKDQADYDIWSEAFMGCENLRKVTIEYDEQSWYGATQLSDRIFAECWNLEEVTFGDGYYPWWPDGDPFAESPFAGEF